MADERFVAFDLLFDKDCGCVRGDAAWDDLRLNRWGNNETKLVVSGFVLSLLNAKERRRWA